MKRDSFLPETAETLWETKLFCLRQLFHRQGEDLRESILRELLSIFFFFFLQIDAELWKKKKIIYNQKYGSIRQELNNFPLPRSVW